MFGSKVVENSRYPLSSVMEGQNDGIMAKENPISPTFSKRGHKNKK